MKKSSTSYNPLLTTLRTTFHTHRTLPLSFRLHQLRQLLRLYTENTSLIQSALKLDMHKSSLESYLYEFDLMQNDCRQAIANLRRWMEPKRLHRNLLTPADCAYTVRQPLGVVLIIGPWNYPFQLTLVPLCGAIAGGNCAVVKPSEVSRHAAATMAKLIPMYLDPDCYRVVLGGREEAERLLEEQWDHVFYTGSYGVALEIERKIGRYLGSATFELGGKSPCYIDPTAHLPMTARRIMWGKCMNMGQTCLAPDYVLLPRSLQDEFIAECKRTILEWYGADPKKAPDLARIINLHHFDRLKRLIEGCSGRIAMGGGMDEKDLWIEPTILVDVDDGDGLMMEEVFGPVLPILNVEGEDEAIDYVNSGRHGEPLCMYVFSTNPRTQERFQLETSSGTMAFNDTIVQFAIDELPFGGIGKSGRGRYHGKFSFDTFTHEKSIVKRDFSWVGDQVGIFRYPPYSPLKINFLSFLLCHWKKFQFVYFDYVPEMVCLVVGVVVGMVLCGWFQSEV